MMLNKQLTSPSPQFNPPNSVRQWTLILHLSQYVGLLIPFGGFIAPIIIWQNKKEEIPQLNDHFKNIMKWQFSMLMHVIVSTIFLVVLIGFVLLVFLGIVWLAFPLIGAIRANKGELWHYPLTIKLL